MGCACPLTWRVRRLWVVPRPCRENGVVGLTWRLFPMSRQGARTPVQTPIFSRGARPHLHIEKAGQPRRGGLGTSVRPHRLKASKKGRDRCIGPTDLKQASFADLPRMGRSCRF